MKSHIKWMKFTDNYRSLTEKQVILSGIKRFFRESLNIFIESQCMICDLQRKVIFLTDILHLK